MADTYTRINTLLYAYNMLLYTGQYKYIYIYLSLRKYGFTCYILNRVCVCVCYVNTNTLHRRRYI